MKKYTTILLIAITGLSLFLNIFWQQFSPPCVNADEAAFGYNAYSLLKTGKDEYGTPLPLRLKSFGDYKLPLYSYLSIPAVALMGLNDTSTRAVNTVLAAAFPFLMYCLLMALFRKRTTAIVGAFVVAISVGLHIVSRQAHEAYLATFLLTLTTLFFVKTVEKFSWKNALFLALSLLLALFSYQSSRIFALFFIGAGIVYFGKKQRVPVILLVIAAVALFTITDVLYNPTRVQNLLFFNNQGFSLALQEYTTEGGIRHLHNILTEGIKTVIFQHLAYFSPQYFVLNGDANPRFGYKGLSILTPIEYLFIFVGLYFLFKNKEKYRWFIVGLFILTPLSASLTWADMSLTRILFFLIPTLALIAYGLTYFIESVLPRYKLLTIIGIAGMLFFFSVLNWDFYLFHYPKRALTIRAWQCGNKEMADYIKSHYTSTDHFYITKKNGQPYIFLLYYLQYPPEKYQQQAQLSAPDNFGFGQVERFDKFDFNFQIPQNGHNFVSIGYPEDFAGTHIDQSRVKKIQIRSEEVFWIYESPT